MYGVICRYDTYISGTKIFCLLISKMHSLLQTGLANTVIDNPLAKTQETRVDQILEYLLTDTVWLVCNLLKLVNSKQKNQ